MSSATVPISPEDVPDTGALTRALLALNNAHAIELSLLDSRRLRSLVAEVFVARRIGEDDAMILAFDQDAAYDSPNFIWRGQRRPAQRCLSRVSRRDGLRARRLRRPGGGREDRELSGPAAPGLTRAPGTGADRATAASTRAGERLTVVQEALLRNAVGVRPVQRRKARVKWAVSE
jgi:hypothetical protein